MGILAIVVCLHGSAHAQEFANASFQGTYAMQGSVGSGTAVLGINVADGNGNITGPAIQRIGNRRRYEVDLQGTYTVNADGTGTVTGTIAFKFFESPPQTLDFVIMQAEVVNGVKLATEIFMIQRAGDMGNVAVFTYKRLPD